METAIRELGTLKETFTASKTHVIWEFIVAIAFFIGAICTFFVNIGIVFSITSLLIATFVCWRAVDDLKYTKGTFSVYEKGIHLTDSDGKEFCAKFDDLLFITYLPVAIMTMRLPFAILGYRLKYNFFIDKAEFRLTNGQEIVVSFFFTKKVKKALTSVASKRDKDRATYKKGILTGTF